MNVGFALGIFFLQTCNANNELAEPDNFTLFALNTQYILTWDWNHRIAGDHAVTFTTEYLAKYKLNRKRKKDWSQVCVRSPDRHCDLTGCQLNYLGMYTLRVQATVDGLHSDWVLKDFCPDKDANLGPPSRVEISPVSNLLEVAISDPLTNTGESMRKHMPSLSYRIHYWVRSADPQGLSPRVLDSVATRVVLPELAAWTWYCVRVQSRYAYYTKTSHYTPTQCLQTEGQTPHWQILLYFLSSLVVCFLLVLLSSYTTFRCYRILKATFYPSIQLPAHIHKYLCDSSSSSSDMPRLLPLESEAELICDRLSMCSDTVLLEIHASPPLVPGLTAPPLGPEQDGGDSEGYFTQGGSVQQRVSSSQPIRAGQDSLQTPLLSEKVKMEKMGGDLADKRVMDETVMDMCV